MYEVGVQPQVSTLSLIPSMALLIAAIVFVMAIAADWRTSYKSKLCAQYIHIK